MASYGSILFVYILGGLTFLPLVISCVLLYAFFILPLRQSTSSSLAVGQDVLDGADTNEKLLGAEAATKEIPPEVDVAAGYFAVCREYVPGGVNGKPPERTTPAGTVIAAESPSVYQSMYRSIFDRGRNPSVDNGKGGKRARNVFYVVLRHGHLMLYDDSDQVEVRYVIALAHYNISIYGGDGPIPEGELYIKRNAICLTKRAVDGDNAVDGQPSKPFYLFSDNCSDKEDFYLALVSTQERESPSGGERPIPQRFAVKDMIALVQKLHSSEENLQTRWLNAGVGRLFLALYKTTAIAELVRTKLTRKIARVKKPAFLTDIKIESIDLGDGPAYITNPRLKDLTVDGGCSLEVDIDYAGNFRLQVATKARLDLGARFKAREVDLVLVVVVKKLEGHGVVRFKPPPSNRFWFTFEQMPKLEMSIEPIVSSRQITYNIILRAIESRIREVIAETVVSPNWDDIPFTDSSNQQYRGGIWVDHEAKHTVPESTLDTTAEQVDAELGSKERVSPEAEDKSPGKPETPTSSPSRPPKKEAPSETTPKKDKAAASSTGADAKPRLGRPGSWRSGTYAAAGTPVVGTDTTTVDAFKDEKKKDQDDATTKMMAISNRCQSTSPASSPVGSPSNSVDLPEPSGSVSSTSSRGSHGSDTAAAAPTQESATRPSTASTQTDFGKGSVRSMPGFGNDPTISPSPSSLTVGSQASTSSKRSLAALTSATASVAKKWGWKAKSGDDGPSNLRQTKGDENREGTPSRPIGRGRPLPPPGTPLPPPERDKSKRNSGGVPNRKRVPSPRPPKLQDNTSQLASASSTSISGKRRSAAGHNDDGGLLVVSAPSDSRPSTPLSERAVDDLRPATADDEEGDATSATPASSSRQEDDGSISDALGEPPSPRATRPTSRSFAEDEDARPDWLSAQERTSQSRGLWIDPENEQL